MAFFEQIGRHLTDVGQNVAQQTKNFADVTQFNNAISEKKKKISQLYLEIGEFYYEKHKDDVSVEQSEKIADIKQLYKEILQCTEKIKQIKGVTKCVNCGVDIPIHAVFCNSCGAKVGQTVVSENIGENSRTCPVCNLPVNDENLFCNHCGAKMGNI